MKKSIGIIGGMGPLATADLFQKIILLTPAATDQEHIRVYIDNNTNIPDRTAAILHGGADPLPHMVESAKKLAAMGADALVLPCNTAYYFYDGVCSAVEIPVLHMIRETAWTLKEQGVQCAGLLATSGTVRSGLYQRALKEQGIDQVLPDMAGQEAVMSLTYDFVKAGRPLKDQTAMKTALRDMKARGAQIFILGCTELPIAFEQYEFGVPTIDPTAMLAKSAVMFATGK